MAARYLQTAFHINPSDAELYDLTINTAVLDLDAVVDLIELALARKARRLDVPATALGPAAGVGAYPGHVEDLHPRSGDVYGQISRIGCSPGYEWPEHGDAG